MMRKIIVTNKFKKDVKRAMRRGLPLEKLDAVVLKLANDEELPASNRDHQLIGRTTTIRECHIQPDWLLIYSKDEVGEVRVLELLETGTHADLFKM